MNKFKVGDRVKYVHFVPNWDGTMPEEQTGTITRVIPIGDLLCESLGVPYYNQTGAIQYGVKLDKPICGKYYDAHWGENHIELINA